MNVDRKTLGLGIAALLGIWGIVNASQAHAIYSASPDGAMPDPGTWMKILAPFIGSIISGIVALFPAGGDPLVKAILQVVSEFIKGGRVASVDVMLTMTDGTKSPTIHIDIPGARPEPPKVEPRPVSVAGPTGPTWPHPVYQPQPSIAPVHPYPAGAPL